MVSARLRQPIDIAPLAVFRIAFGGLMAIEIGRFIAQGWIDALYVAPGFHFSFPGFGWLRPLPAEGMHLLFALLLTAAWLILLGAYTRAAALAFGLGFGYLLLLDAARYQNHFYLICLLAFWLAALPAGRAWSLDARVKPQLRLERVPAWTRWLLIGQLAVVYFWAGIAKLNPDWLAGIPMGLFLADRGPMPFVDPWLDPLLGQAWMPLALSWGGLAFDLAFVPLILWPPTRLLALGLAGLFHLANAALFPIGIFPWLMLASLPLFLPPAWSRRGLEAGARTATRVLGRTGILSDDGRGPAASLANGVPDRPPTLLLLFLGLQAILPIHAYLGPGNPGWTGAGDYLAWRMMLDRREGTVVFDWVAPDGRRGSVDPRATLPDWQARVLAIRPGMLRQYARHLAAEARDSDGAEVAVHARTALRLNGRPPAPLVDPAVDLAAQGWSWRRADWVTAGPGSGTGSSGR